MAKKIIILERIGEPSDYSFNALFWLDIPTTRQGFYIDANATSAYKGATTQEIQDIKDGKIKEVSIACNYLVGTTFAQIKADLISKYTDLQNNLNNSNPFVKYGTYWDGSAWTNVGII